MPPNTLIVTLTFNTAGNQMRVTQVEVNEDGVNHGPRPQRPNSGNIPDRMATKVAQATIIKTNSGCMLVGGNWYCW